MGKFKVGDRVRVKNIEVGTNYHLYIFISEMSKYVGKKFTIKGDWGDGTYMLEGALYSWAEDWIEPVKSETKCSKEEEPKPKLYNGKVVCVTSLCNNVTKGKIYEFKDGYSQYDSGHRMPVFQEGVTSFGDLEKKIGGIFVELVED